MEKTQDLISDFSVPTFKKKEGRQVEQGKTGIWRWASQSEGRKINERHIKRSRWHRGSERK